MFISLFDLFAVRGQLSVCDSLLTYGDRIVIPASMRADMLERIHEGHFGINKCLERARHTVWWPGITSDIKRIVSNCESCQVKLRSNTKEPLYTTPLPDSPWMHVGADLFEFEGQDYIVLTDCYS